MDIKSRLTGRALFDARRAFWACKVLSTGALWLGDVLLDYQRANKSCFPSIYTLSKNSGFGWHAIKNWLLELQHAGYLKMEPRKGHRCRKLFFSYLPIWKNEKVVTEIKPKLWSKIDYSSHDSEKRTSNYSRKSTNGIVANRRLRGVIERERKEEEIKKSPKEEKRIEKKKQEIREKLQGIVAKNS